VKVKEGRQAAHPKLRKPVSYLSEVRLFHHGVPTNPEIWQEAGHYQKKAIESTCYRTCRALFSEF
jgi:hypothetical protein